MAGLALFNWDTIFEGLTPYRVLIMHKILFFTMFFFNIVQANERNDCGDRKYYNDNQDITISFDGYILDYCDKRFNNPDNFECCLFRKLAEQ